MEENEFNELLKIQRMMAARIIQESTVDRKIEFVQIVNQLVPGKNKKILTETLRHEARLEGFADNEIDKFIEELINEKIITQSEDGYIRLG